MQRRSHRIIWDLLKHISLEKPSRLAALRLMYRSLGKCSRNTQEFSTLFIRRSYTEIQVQHRFQRRSIPQQKPAFHLFHQSFTAHSSFATFHWSDFNQDPSGKSFLSAPKTTLRFLSRLPPIAQRAASLRGLYVLEVETYR